MFLAMFLLFLLFQPWMFLLKKVYHVHIVNVEPVQIVVQHNRIFIDVLSPHFQKKKPRGLKPRSRYEGLSVIAPGLVECYYLHQLSAAVQMICHATH